MAEMPRLKRFDRAGNTESIPWPRTLKDVKAQRWIANRFFRLMGRGAFFWENPEEYLGQALERGTNYFDIKDTGARIKSLEQAPKENVRTALRLEKLGKREEETGHRETACEYYYKSCLFYVAASWSIFDSDDKELVWLSEKIKAVFDKVVKYNSYPMESVEIPFEGKSLPGA